MTEITIPDSVTSIGFGAFSGCTALESISLPFIGAARGDTTNSHFGYIFGAAAYSDQKRYISKVLKDVVITDTTEIGRCAFYDCTMIESITLPDGLITIVEWAFAYCYNLAEIKIPSTVTTIGVFAFRSCTSLTSVVIPDSVTIIAQSVFRACTALTDVTIGSAVATIGRDVFYECSALSSVTFKNTSGWKAGSTSIDVTDSAVVTYLTDTHRDSVWTRS